MIKNHSDRMYGGRCSLPLLCAQSRAAGCGRRLRLRQILILE
jgi:hypothetical protein